uniref:Tectonin beta-propeller repeat-containing protein 1 n=1 Tax=Anolis carolinensis TaxID=28377 RepID=H9G635_ANOCA
MPGPGSMLWAVDVFGRVYTLSASGQAWERLCGDGPREFKRVSAAKPCCWGIACDHQVYVYVHAGDLPIRCQEEAYENQRWNPVTGFCEKLLPSDRWPWSDATGLEHRALGGFALPSAHWEWEQDWHLDHNCHGEPTAQGGWTYAMDFPAAYTKEQRWNSCVRRRRWIRFRRYAARDAWAQIPSPEDPKQLPDPFSDLSVGGWEISEEPAGRLSVWAVSLQGKVWYREGVCHHNPEGSSWSLVSAPGEAVQISCGPDDLVWATLWEGQAAVREGIDRNNPQGLSWTVVEPPDPACGLLHVSVGVNVVWALTKDRKVWFRRGVNSHNPSGTSWIGMVGELVMLDVGLNDQVWGVGCEERAVLFRQGVTRSELSGKAWKALACGRDGDRSQAGSATSLLSAGCFFTDDIREQSGSGPHPGEERPPDLEGADAASTCGEDGRGEDGAPACPGVSALSETPPAPEKGPEDPPSPCPPPGPGASEPEPPPAELRWSNIDLKEAAKPPPTASSALAETGSLGSFGLEDPLLADERPLWAWVSGGACLVEPQGPPKWFAAQPGRKDAISLSGGTSAWRTQILQQLSERTRRENQDFQHYEQARPSVWVKTGSLQWWRSWKPHKWVDVRVALEQFTGQDGARDSILFLYYMHFEEKKYIHVFLNEVTILVEILNEAKHSFALYTPERTKQRWPLRLAAPTEQEMRDWVSLLSAACCEGRALGGHPSRRAIWSLTCKGDVFASEPTPHLEDPARPDPCNQMFWRQVGGHLRLVESSSRGVTWGLGYDHTAWVYTGGGPGGSSSGLSSSGEHAHTQTDVKCVYIYENQRWNPVSGYSSRGLPTDRYMWSDASGLQERTKDHTKPPSPQWAWASDWFVDFGISGGTDREGWQYAADFPALRPRSLAFRFCAFRAQRHFLFSRQVLPRTQDHQGLCASEALGQVSTPPGLPPHLAGVALWAVSDKGDVLCRLGVGSSWLHVGTDQPFLSVSIGSFHQVWAVAQDGSVFFRGSVSTKKPEGDGWYHIPSPPKQKLKQVSVGRTSVFSVDQNGNLWYRQGITPSYPQGSAWEHVSNNVRRVSVGPLDQVWVIADKVQGSHSLSCGTVCHRLGVRPGMQPKGLSWDYGIGVGCHITLLAHVHLPPHEDSKVFFAHTAVKPGIVPHSVSLISVFSTGLYGSVDSR